MYLVFKLITRNKYKVFYSKKLVHFLAFVKQNKEPKSIEIRKSNYKLQVVKDLNIFPTIYIASYLYLTEKTKDNNKS